jgi:ABC-type Zn uptake system ZnuABC Zn-binding protein ZnuA
VRRILLSIVACTCALAAAGCGSEDPGAGEDAALQVVATTTQVADVARNAAGSRAQVTSLLEPNSDPHDFEPRPSDLEALAAADLILRSGGEVDGWLGEAIEASGSGAPVVDLLGRVHRLGDDPHWWQDPRNALRAAAAIKAELVAVDPAGEAEYRRAGRAYRGELRALDGAIQACIDALPADRRKLVTSHDALGYFAAAYGLEIVGAVIPSRSSRGLASAADATRLAEQIRSEGVPAVFAEHALPAKVARAVAAEAGARAGGALYTDALGAQGTPAGTYLGAMAANARAISAGLAPAGGAACRLPR